ncbi:hypothetical protein ABT369_02985 [Dactylosporangium sp. NPDC000244]|uniref:hypothetical protein n=1 Tax=Dactylosporangium sp. NPDC000244 TaxID=3154365 RepID=UPI00332088FE
MLKKVVIGIAAAVSAGALALGIGFGIAADRDSAQHAPTAESRPAKDGEMPAPPAPPQLKPSERVVVIGK